MHFPMSWQLFILPILLALLPASLQAPAPMEGQGTSASSGSAPTQVPSLVVDPIQKMSLQQLMMKKPQLGWRFYQLFPKHCAIKQLPLGANPMEYTDAEKLRLADAVLALRSGVYGEMLVNLVARTTSYLNKNILDPGALAYIEERWRHFLQERAYEVFGCEEVTPQQLEEYAPRRTPYHRKKREQEEEDEIDPYGIDQYERTLPQLLKEKPEEGKDKIPYMTDLCMHPTMQRLFKYKGKSLVHHIISLAKRQQGMTDEQKRKFRDELTEMFGTQIGDPDPISLVKKEWRAVSVRAAMKRCYDRSRNDPDFTLSHQNRLKLNQAQRINKPGPRQEGDAGCVQELIQKGPGSIPDEAFGPEPPFQSSSHATDTKDWEHHVDASGSGSTMHHAASPLQTPGYDYNLFDVPIGFEPLPSSTGNNQQYDATTKVYPEFNQFHHDPLLNLLHLHHQHQHLQYHHYQNHHHQQQGLLPPVTSSHWQGGLGDPMGGYHYANVDPWTAPHRPHASLPTYGMTSDDAAMGGRHNTQSDILLNELWSAPFYPGNTGSIPPSLPPTTRPHNRLGPYGRGHFRGF